MPSPHHDQHLHLCLLSNFWRRTSVGSGRPCGSSMPVVCRHPDVRKFFSDYHRPVIRPLWTSVKSTLVPLVGLDAETTDVCKTPDVRNKLSVTICPVVRSRRSSVESSLSSSIFCWSRLRSFVRSRTSGRIFDSGRP